MALNQICSQYVRGKKSGTVINGYGKKGALIGCIKCFVHLLNKYLLSTTSSHTAGLGEISDDQRVAF